MRGERKKALNGFVCLVHHGSRGGPACDDKQRHALSAFPRPLPGHTAQPATSTASRCGLSLYSAVLYHLFILQISGGV